MSRYTFDLVSYERKGPIEDPNVLLERPSVNPADAFERDAPRFVPGEQLEVAINTAIAVGEPLLITGEPGTGKTQTAYYAAYKLGLKPVLRYQVKSDSSARDLLYSFDTVRYFHDSFFRKGELPEKSRYVEPRVLWEAITADQPRVVLIDEIDKAPRDFPNDLLYELDKMRFTVVETNEEICGKNEGNRPIVFITSNSERRLPEPFLRRCVYHHIRFDKDVLKQAVASRSEDYKNLSPAFIERATERFLKFRTRNLRKQPSTGEFLVWLRLLSITATPQAALEGASPLSRTPYLGTLLKDRQDVEEIEAG